MYVNVKPEDLKSPTCVECDPTNTFKKYYDSIEKEKLQREAEHDRLLKLVDSYAKLVDRLEEQIEALSRERVAANQLGVDPNQCTTLR